MRIAFVLSYGLLPLWIASCVLCYALATRRTDEALVLLWLLIAAMPATIVTLAISFSTIVIYKFAKGTPRNKRLISCSFLLLASVAAAIFPVRSLFDRYKMEEDTRLERAQVEDFVRRNTEITKSAGEPILAVSAITAQGSPGSMPIGYEVSVTGVKTIYAIVKVKREAGSPAFMVACTTPVYFGHRDTSKPECAQ